MGIIFSLLLHRCSRKRPYRALILPTDKRTGKIFFSELPLPKKVTDTTTEIRYNSLMEIVSFNCAHSMYRKLCKAEFAKGIDWVIVVVNGSNHKTATTSSDIIMKDFQGIFDTNRSVIILVYSPKLKNSVNKHEYLFTHHHFPEHWSYYMDEIQDRNGAKEFVDKIFGEKILQFRILR